MDPKDLKQLLRGTNLIIRHQREVEELKGESFNIFSVLGVETKENKTHSAFLGELLNPKGSHLKKDIFLKLFLMVISCNHLDSSNTKVKLEHYVGKKNNKDKTGGRIDIFLRDKKGNSISIENKIHATDQFAQIERYSNYNKSRNKVFYLNLDGNEPEEWSSGNLRAGEDYMILSYKREILHWLELCQKEAADSPILRENIKQYHILIKKLTSTMDQREEKELFDIILKDYKAAQFVANNFEKARRMVAERVRLELADLLQEVLGEKYRVIPGADTSNRWSKIWIEIEGITSNDLKLGVENFNEKGHLGGFLFFAVFTNDDRTYSYANYRESGKINSWWSNPVKLKFEEEEISFGNLNLISKLNSDQSFRKKFINEIVNELKELIEQEKHYIESFREKSIAEIK